MSEAARAWACGAANATALADRLENRGLVNRQPSPGDRRRVRLVVTSHGLEVRRRLSEGFHLPPPELAELPEALRHTLVDILERAVTHPEHGTP